LGSHWSRAALQFRRRRAIRPRDIAVFWRATRSALETVG